MTAAEQDARVLRAIRNNPSMRADEIATHLDWYVPEVSASLRRLKSARAVRTKGNTRGMRYTAK